jgi:hypothetical protein
MSDQQTIQGTLEKLRTRGDARGSTNWPNGEPDYLAEYALTDEHIPALISLATQWVDAPAEDVVVYGPIHAWRALAQMRAAAAVQPLLDVQDELNEVGDDWYLEEFPQVFGLIGPAAIEPLEAYLSETAHAEYSLVAAANGLREIAVCFPATRDRIVAILTEQLAHHRAGELNAFLVSDLLDLNAVESAEVIERAFAANVVDPVVAGDWGDIRERLGVPGLGIAPDRTPGWPTIRERLGIPDQDAERRQRRADRKQRKKALRRAKVRLKSKRRTPR